MIIRDIETFLSKATTKIVSPKAIFAAVCMTAAFSSFASSPDSTAHQPPTSISAAHSELPSAHFFDDRPDAPFFPQREKQVKMVEVDDPQLGTSIHASQLNRATFALAIRDVAHPVRGYALTTNLPSEDQVSCMIDYKQHDIPVKDGFYIDRTHENPALLPQHYVDFFIKSHEAGHCNFMVRPPGDDPFEATLYTSLNEVASDLTAILDYMRVTGNDDIYQDLIKPFRLASVGSSTHRTVWALDVILKDVRPSAMKGKEPSEIPEIVSYLMHKHMLNENGTEIDLDKKGSAQLYKEVIADLNMVGMLPTPEAEESAEKLRPQISNEVFRQIQRYSTINASEEVLNRQLAVLGEMMDRYDLPYPKGHWLPRMKGLDQDISNRSYAEYYLGR